MNMKDAAKFVGISYGYFSHYIGKGRLWSLFRSCADNNPDSDLPPYPNDNPYASRLDFTEEWLEVWFPTLKKWVDDLARNVELRSAYLNARKNSPIMPTEAALVLMDFLERWECFGLELKVMTAEQVATLPSVNDGVLVLVPNRSFLH